MYRFAKETGEYLLAMEQLRLVILKRVYRNLLWKRFLIPKQRLGTFDDGRNKEPISLPIKFPLLLAQGSEGIGLGLNSRILPHNFNELIDASIACLRNEPFQLFSRFSNRWFIGRLPL